MNIENIINFIENWAPPGASWDKDNVGLQIGSTKRKINNIFLCLELTPKALDEAIKKKANFIFTHHPFIFKPLKKIDTEYDDKSQTIEKLIKNNITLYSAHTNLDFTKNGVSFELAKILGLKNIDFLVNEKANQYKLVVFVPVSALDKVSNALFESGAGIIGEYENCSFNSIGKGTFKGSELTNPTIGTQGNFEVVDEVRLEVIVNKWNLQTVIEKLKATHPYEEPAFDIYRVENNNPNFGFGAMGELSKSLPKKEFLELVCKKLKTNNLRYTEGKKAKIKKVAVCGGSGSDLLKAAIIQKADAFITADVKYHTFQDGENKILFIDAGHYETEIHILNEVKKRIEEFIKINGGNEKVYKFTGSTNPIKFFNKRGVK